MLNMSASKRRKSKVEFAMVNEHAAAIDVGSRSHAVSIGAHHSQSKEYGVFTDELQQLCEWLVASGVKTVAMESTGFYWKQLFVMLQSYGLEVYLVNASFAKNIRGRKPSDMADSRWIWQLHTAGLLPNSFQPDFFTDTLRSYVRHRRRRIQDASRCINRMQKCLVLMNLQLPIVLTDIMGKSGQAIIKAILSGERCSDTLAQLADPRVKADKQTISRALTGFWKEEQLFELEQNWDLYHYYQKQIAECDQKIDALLSDQVQKKGANKLTYTPVKKKRRQKNDGPVPVEQYAYQLTGGVDLLQVDGISYQFIQTFMAEVGTDLSAFPSQGHFASWLCLTPNKKVSGGKVISSKTKKSKHRLRVAFKNAAVAAGKQKDSSLGHYYRKMKAKKGKGTAVTATARKLAIIVYNMIQKGEAYDPKRLEPKQKSGHRKRKIKHIQRTIEQLNVKSEEIRFE